MATVLFICEHNMGRSQVAEALFNRHAKANRAKSCAGTPEVDRRRKLRDIPLDALIEVIEIMKRDYGIDLGDKISKPFDLEIVKKADRVITLCSEEECPRIAGAEHWETPKFSQLDAEGKREAIRALDSKVKSLLKQMEKREVSKW